MHDNFSLTRFWQYFKYDLFNFKSRYGWNLLICCFTPVILYVLYVFFGWIFVGGWEVPPLGARFALLCLVALFICMLAPSKIYGHITDKREGSEYYMLPASINEKYLSMLLIVTVVLPLIFTISFLITDWLITVLDFAHPMKSLIGYNINQELLEAGTDGDVLFVANGVWLYYTAFLSWIMPFLCGALWFKKSKVAKTILALFIFQTIMSMIFTPILVNDSIMHAIKEFGQKYLNTEKAVVDFVNIVTFAAAFVSFAAMTALSYFKFKSIKH